MLRKLLVVVCLLSVGAVLSAGCHAGVEGDKGHGAHVDVGG
jgi:hypothetical protein